MKVHLENLATNRRYALQVRGTGDIETDWSPTYFIQTERDRIAPPVVPNVKVDNAALESPQTTWYGKDLTISWDAYAQSDESTWDHSRYVVEFISDTGHSERFYTTDKKFILYYALNAQRFGGFGCHTFSSVRVWGEDKTGNPSYGNTPWYDGPFVSNETTYVTPGLNNPPPDQLQNLNVNFETPDILFSWDMPSGPNSLDLEYIEVTLSNGIVTKSFEVAPTTSKWTFKYAENKYWFGGLGSPSVSYEVSAVDVFRQRSFIISGTAINEPPQLPVSGLQSIGVFGGIQVKFHDSKVVSNFHKDAWMTEIYEKPKSSVVLSDGDDTLNGYTLIIGTTDNSYDYIPPDYEGPPIVTSFAYRWVRAVYVDVFGQRGPVTKASATPPSEYPVRAIKPGSFVGYAPEPPTDLTISNNFDGSFGVPGEISCTWTPPVDQGLLEYYLEYTAVSMLNATVPSWTSLKIPCDRVYIKSIKDNVVELQSEHSFAIGDRISVVNVATAGAIVHRQVTAVTLTSITIDSTVSGSIIDNSFDRGTPGSAIIRSSAAIEVMPGTEYRFRIKSASTGNSSEASPEVTFKTSGNALVAKKPLEVGTYYDPLDIIEYSAASGLVTVKTTQNPISNGFTLLKVAQGMHVSVRDSAAAINGRWPVTNATSNSVTFQTSGALNASTTPSDGTITAGTMALGALVDGTRNGLMLDSSNMWTSDGTFRVGTNYGTSSWSGIRWEPSEQTFYTSGDIDARSGYFSGNVFLRNNGSLATGKVLKIDSTRQVTTNNPYGTGTQITIPIKTSLSIDTFSYAQIISNSTMIDTSGTPAAFVSISNVTNMQTITVSYAAPQSLHNSYMNGTILLDSSIVLGDGGLTSTDKTGKIKFMLSNSGLNRIGGWDISNNAIKSNIADSTLRSGMSADPLLPSFWAGGNDNSATWRVNEDGNMYLGQLTFQGTTSSTRIYSGVGEWGKSNTPFYLDSAGYFSVSDFFKLSTEGGKMYLGQISFEGNSPTRIWSGAGEWGNQNTPFYIDSLGYFSLGNSLNVYAPVDNVNNQPTFEVVQQYGRLRFDNASGASWFGINSAVLQMLPRNIAGAGTTESLILARSDNDVDYYRHAGAILFPSLPPDDTWETRPSIMSKYSETRTGYRSFWIQNGNVSGTRGHLGWMGDGVTYLNSQSTLYFESNYGEMIARKTDGGTLYFKTSNIPQGNAAYDIRMDAQWNLYYFSSSRESKQDITYFNELDSDTVVEDIYKLNPVYFRYKNKEYDVHDSTFNVGYIAEDLDRDGVDWLVSYDEGKPISINYQLISIGLTEAVKDLNERVVQLNERIAQLEGAQ